MNALQMPMCVLFLTLLPVQVRHDGDGNPTHRVKPEAVDDATSAAYWHLNSPNTFLTYSWLMEDLHREYNEKFFHLTPQNLRIRNDVLTAFVMYRCVSALC